MFDFKEEHVQAIYDGIKDMPKIPELDEILSSEFSVSSEKDILYPLVDSHDVIVVCGAFFGDEGKGKTVAAIADHPDIKLIVRSNSGENAGHTVWLNGVKYVFHLAPSGLLTRKQNAIGPNCVMDPISFMEKEIQQLIDHNIDYSNLTIGNVTIVTPYHKILDALGRKNSSTLKGMSPSHSSKVRKKGLRLDDLFNDEDQQKKIIQADMEVYNALLAHKRKNEEELIATFEAMNEKVAGRIPAHVMDFLKAQDKADYLIGLYLAGVVNNPKFPKRGDVTRLIQRTLEQGDKILLEAAQAFYLSNNEVTHWRRSTSADTTSAGTKAAAGYNQERHKSVTINVHKVPTSRVGIGENPSGYVKQDYFSKRDIETLTELGAACDDFDAIQKLFFESIQDNGVIKPVIYKDDTGEYTIGAAMAIGSAKEHEEQGATTKKPRICGIFDCVAQHKTNNTQGPYLSISAVDRLDIYDKVGLVIGYVVIEPGLEGVIDSNGTKYKNGDVIKPGDDMPCENVLKHCYPLVKVMDGWKDTPIAAGKRKPDEQLPKQCQRFLGEISHYTGSEIISIGNGAETKNLVYIQKK
ncbi:adenylosuccinate synthetase [Candidatus Woesearchaeota archaeon]|nr:adenylosuccinate synthetase [Candidatus Woesearchaeota archaeon]